MRSRRTLILTSVVTGTALSLLAAGCGGAGSPGVAGVAASTTTTAAQNAIPASALVAFSRCMRTNGAPSFPDPQHMPGGNVKLTIHQYGNAGPKFQTALNACNHLLPNRGSQQTAAQLHTQLLDELSFAKCMRSHGEARFPDPTAQGELSVAMVQAQGIDVHSPAVLHVVQTCLPASHGALTAKKVEEAINNAGH
ncbi:MAG TPA: hypothetical protein VGG88_06220 [Gaiellaceae bacterium]|jgi:hypothetical protein